MAWLCESSQLIGTANRKLKNPGLSILKSHARAWVSCRPCCSNQRSWCSIRIQSMVSSHGLSVTGSEIRMQLSSLPAVRIVCSGKLSLDLTECMPVPCCLFMLLLLLLQYLQLAATALPSVLLYGLHSVWSFITAPQLDCVDLYLQVPLLDNFHRFTLRGHMNVMSKGKACGKFVFTWIHLVLRELDLNYSCVLKCNLVQSYDT